MLEKFTSWIFLDISPKDLYLVVGEVLEVGVAFEIVRKGYLSRPPRGELSAFLIHRLWIIKYNEGGKAVIWEGRFKYSCKMYESDD